MSTDVKAWLVVIVCATLIALIYGGLAWFLYRLRKEAGVVNYNHPKRPPITKRVNLKKR